MKQSWFTGEQIIRLLKWAEGGEPIAALYRETGVGNTTFQHYRKAKYGGLVQYSLKLVSSTN